MKTQLFANELSVKAMELLFRYYGLKLDATLNSGQHSECPDAQWELESIRRDYFEYISPSENDELIQCVVFFLCNVIRDGWQTVTEESLKKSLEKYVRQDLLRLYVFGNETLNNYNNVSIRSKDGAVRLTNCCNWIWNDLFKPYLDNQLSDIKNLEQAKNELLTGHSRRGRKPNDSRVPVIIWGTYQLLTDLHGFDTPMPNCLCNYIIKLLQHTGIIQEDTEIDALWIRAELRYINSRPVKPRFDDTNRSL